MPQMVLRAQFWENLMNKYDAIFFDWDGVITDSVNVKTEAFVELFKQYGPEIQNKVKFHHLNNGGMSRFKKFKHYFNEFLGLEITEEKIIELSDEFSRIVTDKIIQAPLINGVIETIQKQYALGTKLFVISGTPMQEMQLIAKEKGLSKFFIEILGSPNEKTHWINYLLEKYNLKPEACLFIGDAMADFTAANNTHVDFLGIKIKGCATKFPDGTKIKEEVNIE